MSATYGSLTEVVERLDELDRRSVLYAARPWSPESPIFACRSDEIGQRPEGYEYLLEVNLFEDVLETWSSWRGGRVPSTGEACAAIIWYADHDAYQSEDVQQSSTATRPPESH